MMTTNVWVKQVGAPKYVLFHVTFQFCNLNFPSFVINCLAFGRSGMTTSYVGTPKNMKTSHPSEYPRSSSGDQILSSTTSECEHCGQRANPSLQIFSARGVKVLLAIIPPYFVLCG